MKNWFKNLRKAAAEAAEADKQEPFVVDEDQGGCECAVCVFGDIEPVPVIEPIILDHDDEII